MSREGQITTAELEALTRGPVLKNKKGFSLSKISLSATLIDLAIMSSIALAYLAIASFVTSGYVFHLDDGSKWITMLLAAVAIHVGIVNEIDLDGSLLMPISIVMRFLNLLGAVVVAFIAFWITVPLIFGLASGFDPNVVVAMLFFGIITAPLLNN